MAFRQLVTPNLTVAAMRGWCLKYVDDSVAAPSRKATAQISWNTNPDKRGGDPPLGVWTPIFFSLNKGAYAGLGHIAWAFNHGNGWIEIHDSETRPGARAVYRNIGEVLRWFGNNGIAYSGWSTQVDGKQVIEEFTPPPASINTGRIAAKGTAKVIVDALNVRNDPSNDNGIVATYGKGQTFNYDSYQVNDGFVWLSYMSNSGVRRYIAEGPDDGRDDTVYVSGGV